VVGEQRCQVRISRRLALSDPWDFSGKRPLAMLLTHHRYLRVEAYKHESARQNTAVPAAGREAEGIRSGDRKRETVNL